MNTKVILITGTSSGFGRDLVSKLLERGHTVIAALRGDVARFHNIYAQEIKLYGQRLHYFELHLDRPDSFAGMASFIENTFKGQLDVLINNAGYGLMGPVEDMTESQIRKQLEVNFMGPVLLTQSLLPFLRKSRGRVINVSSICGLVTLPFYGMYCASKHALEAYSEGLYYDMKPFGVQVALVEPGGFKTNFTSSSLVFSELSGNPDSPYFGKARSFERLRRDYGDRLPSPAPVIRRVVVLCENEKIPLRSTVGFDAQAMAILSKMLPDCWRVPLMEWIFRMILDRH